MALAGCGGEGEPNDAPYHSSLVPVSSEGFREVVPSQNPGDGQGWSFALDDFILDEDATVTSVAWQGAWCLQQPGSSAPEPNATHFSVRFYPDDEGGPNDLAPIQSATYPVAATNQTFEKSVPSLVCGTTLDTEFAYYRYQVDLASPVTLSAGTTYWIGIQAESPSAVINFGWRDGTTGNGLSLQVADGITTHHRDRAFSLER